MKKTCYMRLQFSFLGWMLMLLFLPIICKTQSSYQQQIEIEKLPVKWHLNATWINKEEAVLTIIAIMEEGYYLYAQSVSSDEGLVPVKFEFDSSLDYTLIGKMKEEHTPVLKYDRLFGRSVSCHDKAASYTQRVKINVLSTTIKGNILFMVAGENEVCVMSEEKFEVKLKMKEVPSRGS